MRMQRSRRKFRLGTLHQKSEWVRSLSLCQPAARHDLLKSLIKDKWNLFIQVYTYIRRCCTCTWSLCALKFFQMFPKTLCIFSVLPPLSFSLRLPPPPFSFIFSLSGSLHFTVCWLSLDGAQAEEHPLGGAGVAFYAACLSVTCCPACFLPPCSQHCHLKPVLLPIPRWGEGGSSWHLSNTVVWMVAVYMCFRSSLKPSRIMFP